MCRRRGVVCPRIVEQLVTEYCETGCFEVMNIGTNRLAVDEVIGLDGSVPDEPVGRLGGGVPVISDPEEPSDARRAIGVRG